MPGFGFNALRQSDLTGDVSVEAVLWCMHSQISKPVV